MKNIGLSKFTNSYLLLIRITYNFPVRHLLLVNSFHRYHVVDVVVSDSDLMSAINLVVLVHIFSHYEYEVKIGEKKYSQKKT